MTPDPLNSPREIARAISLVENETAAGEALIRSVYRQTGHAFLIGVTGPPGAGKSTLADRLTTIIRREGLKVAIIAVDPSSPFTGGALLGDRVRMGGHAGDPGVFIRSTATRGHLGGLAGTTADVALVLDAAGFDVVLIETVGVGQAEVDIVRLADVSIVTLVPGAGDDIQTLKAGIMEIADIFVVNKADRDGADKLVHTIAASQSLQSSAPHEWKPPILTTVATTNTGVAELWGTIVKFREQHVDIAARRRARHASRLHQVLSRRVMQQLEQALPAGEMERALDELEARLVDPYTVADRLIEAARRESHTRPERT
jgi:LAO/AO transport system kinase